MSAHRYLVGVCTKCGHHAGADPSGAPCPLEDPEPALRRANFIGAPGFFLLNQACRIVWEAYPEAFGLYLVGSSLRRRSYRDVDLRLILPDEDYKKLFPGISSNGWLHPLWSLTCSSISLYLSKASNLPIDFQIQSQTEANRDYPAGHPRSAIGLFLHTKSEVAKEALRQAVTKPEEEL